MSEIRKENPVLILGTAPRIAVPIARSLHRIGVPVEVASFGPDDPVLRSNSIRACHSLQPDDPERINSLCSIIEKKNFDMVIPTSDVSLAFVAKHYDRLRAIAYPGCPPPEIVDRVLNKGITLSVAERLGIAIPLSFRVTNAGDLEDLAGKLRFPVVLKPAERRSQSFKVEYFRSAAELVAFLSANKAGPLLVQNYCPGDGVGIEMLMHNGTPVATFQHRRLKEAPASGGVAVTAISEEINPVLAQASYDLLRAIEWEGPAMVEFRYDRKTGALALMEINGRFWGTTSLPILAGIDFPLYTWQVIHGIAPQVPESYRVGMRWRWTSGYVDRFHGLFSGPSKPVGNRSAWSSITDVPRDFSPTVRDALWLWSDPTPALAELVSTLRRWLIADAKWLVRKLVPRRMLRERGIYHRLGPQAGPIYARLRAADTMGVALENRRTVPQGARSFVFICHGNIMRSPMAERMMQRSLVEHGQDGVKVCSAGMHALPGREAHPLSQLVSEEIGLSLRHHRAQLMTKELADQADAIFAMDFQNKAELLARFPDASDKIFMLSAYAEGTQKFREIVDPYFGDENEVRRCYKILQTCVHNLVKTLWPADQLAEAQGVGAIR